MSPLTTVPGIRVLDRGNQLAAIVTIEVAGWDATDLSKPLRKRGINTSASLCDQPQSTEALAKASGTQPNALYRVPRLLASVGIFEWEHGAWHRTDGSRFLRSDHPGSLRDYVRMLGLPVFWNAFGDPDHSLRTGKSAFGKAPICPPRK